MTWFVCLLSVCPRFGRNSPKKEAPASFNPQSALFRGRQKRVLKKKTFKKLVKTFPGPRFLTFFSKINISKTPCPEGVCRRRYHSVNLKQTSDKRTDSKELHQRTLLELKVYVCERWIRIVALDLGSPLRGRTALRVQSSIKSYVPWFL